MLTILIFLPILGAIACLALPKEQEDKARIVATVFAVAAFAVSIAMIYQFDTSGAGAPRYVDAASVPGWLINQYAMSEWDGHLRVATTSGRNCSQS